MNVLEQLKKDLAAESEQSAKTLQAYRMRKSLRGKLALDCKHAKQATRVLNRHNLPNGFAYRMWQEAIAVVNQNEAILENLAKYIEISSEAVEVRSYILKTMEDLEK